VGLEPTTSAPTLQQREEVPFELKAHCSCVSILSKGGLFSSFAYLQLSYKSWEVFASLRAFLMRLNYLYISIGSVAPIKLMCCVYYFSELPHVYVWLEINSGCENCPRYSIDSNCQNGAFALGCTITQWVNILSIV
jgi:hypothetical protein